MLLVLLVIAWQDLKPKNTGNVFHSIEGTIKVPVKSALQRCSHSGRDTLKYLPSALCVVMLRLNKLFYSCDTFLTCIVQLNMISTNFSAEHSDLRSRLLYKQS